MRRHFAVAVMLLLIVFTGGCASQQPRGETQAPAAQPVESQNSELDRFQYEQELLGELAPFYDKQFEAGEYLQSEDANSVLSNKGEYYQEFGHFALKITGIGPTQLDETKSPVAMSIDLIPQGGSTDSISAGDVVEGESFGGSGLYEGLLDFRRKGHPFPESELEPTTRSKRDDLKAEVWDSVTVLADFTVKLAEASSAGDNLNSTDDSNPAQEVRGVFLSNKMVYITSPRTIDGKTVPSMYVWSGPDGYDVGWDQWDVVPEGEGD